MFFQLNQTNNTEPTFGNLTDSFCGVDGGLSASSFWIYKDEMFLSDCLREMVLIGIPHTLYLLIIWYRLISIFYIPKWFSVVDFFKQHKIPWMVKMFHLVRMYCMVACFILVDIKLIYSLFSKDFLIATVNYIVDAIKILAWLVCIIVTTMEMQRNLKIWLPTRLFWICTFIGAILKQISYIQNLKKDVLVSSMALDIVQTVLNIFVVVNSLMLSILAIAGICGWKWFETYANAEDKERVKRLDTQRIRIPLKEILRLFFDAWYLLIPGIIFAAAQGICIIEIAEIASDFFTAAQERSVEAFNEALMWFGILVPLAALSAWVTSFCFGIGGEIILDNLKKRLFANYMSFQDLGYLHHYGLGQLISRLTTDCDLMGLALSNSSSQIIPPFVEFFYGSIRLMTISWRVTLLLLFMLVITFIVTTMRSKVMNQKLYAKYTDLKSKATNKAAECLQGMFLIRNFGKESEEQKEYGHLLHVALNVSMKKEFLEACCEAFEIALNNIVILASLAYGTRLILLYYETSDQFNTYILIGVTTIRSFLNVMRVFPDFFNASGASSRILYLTSRKPRINVNKGKTIADDELKGQIEFKNVSFHYPLESGEENKNPKWILKNFNLIIPAQSSVAIVGPSGSGKSTILQLVLRFFDCQEGEILLDGQNLKELRPKWLQQHIGFISQADFLFNTSIAENVNYSCHTKEEVENQEKFWEAIRYANASEIIESHEEKEKFTVGEGGKLLSQGERQRISIARCIRKNPKIALVDEVTSALDAENEAKVLPGLIELGKNRTAIVVATRLQTITHCDTILFLEQGQIIEKGTHEELMALQGRYYSLFMKQQQQQVQQTNPTNDTSLEELLYSLESYQCFENQRIQELVAGLKQKYLPKHQNTSTVDQDKQTTTSESNTETVQADLVLEQESSTQTNEENL